MSTSARMKPQPIVFSPTIQASSYKMSLSKSRSERENSPPPLPKYPQGLTSPELKGSAEGHVGGGGVTGSSSLLSAEKAYDVNDDDDDFDVVDLK